MSGVREEQAVKGAAGDHEQPAAEARGAVGSLGLPPAHGRHLAGLAGPSEMLDRATPHGRVRACHPASRSGPVCYVRLTYVELFVDALLVIVVIECRVED